MYNICHVYDSFYKYVANKLKNKNEQERDDLLQSYLMFIVKSYAMRNHIIDVFEVYPQNKFVQNQWNQNKEYLLYKHILLENDKSVFDRWLDIDLEYTNKLIANRKNLISLIRNYKNKLRKDTKIIDGDGKRKRRMHEEDEPKITKRTRY